MRNLHRKKLRKENHKVLTEEIDTILDAIHEDILIADGNGKIQKVSRSFEDVYGIAGDEILGKTVFDMEKRGVFKPSVIACVLNEDRQITMKQTNDKGRILVVTASPIRNDEGKITKVISFSRDITDFLNLQSQYSELESKMEKCNAEIEVLRSQSIEIEGIVANSSSTKNIIKTINRIAPFDANILLTGESGVGKTMFAKVIHTKSHRFNGPFIEINCGAISENLLESELFGYERGSFTGANKEGKIGLIELAQNGTLFLDEISELPINLQVKILKVIQDKVITRVGGTKEIHVDFRLIAASNKDLLKLIEAKEFREDLYYRLNVIVIKIPGLRERTEDIAPMTVFFLEKFNEKYKIQKVISREVYDLLIKYNWPGNIRDLQNTIERLVLTSEENLISKEQLPDNIKQTSNIYYNEKNTSKLIRAVEETEKSLVVEAYMKFKTTVGVAKALGISQPTAVRKIQKYCIGYKKL